MTHPSTMLAKLDVETRLFHADVDEHWLDLMASGVTRRQYKDHLMRVYGVEAPMESSLAYPPQRVVAARPRSGLVAQDLLALGVSPAKVTALPHCKAVSSFADPAEALGWKYVIERPTQLHAAIKRNVVSRVKDTANACAYLSASDGCAAARWQQLGMLLDEVAQRRHATERMIEAARAAFTCMVAWYNQTREAEHRHSVES